MPTLYNPTRIQLSGQYAGFHYLFPPKSRTVIKGRRLQFRDEVEAQHAEEIASKLYSDLSGMGLCMIDEENPLPIGEYDRIGKDALIGFIEGLIADFNDLASENAAKGIKIPAVPKHYRELQAVLQELKSEGGVETDERGFIGRAELKKLQERGEVNRADVLRQVQAALDRGDMEAAKRFASESLSQPAQSSAIAHDAPPDQFHVRQDEGVAKSARRGPGRPRKGEAA
jgi:hypothetical protein